MSSTLRFVEVGELLAGDGGARVGQALGLDAVPEIDRVEPGEGVGLGLELGGIGHARTLFVICPVVSYELSVRR